MPWGDSNLYLRRRDGQIVMTVEHRAAPASTTLKSNSPMTAKNPPSPAPDAA